MSDLVKFVKGDGETVVEINTEKATLEAALSLGWRPVEDAGGKQDGPNATNGAIELAKEAGIDLADVPGFGAEAVRLSKSDVQKYIDEKGGD